MITVYLQGGIGNQLFQWAMYRSLELDKHKPRLGKVQLDPVRLEGGKRCYLLHTMGLNPRLGAAGQGPDVLHVLEGSLHYRPRILGLEGDATLDGYWQSEKYFMRAQSVVRNDIRWRCGAHSDETRKMARMILTTANSCFLHVRRTDMISPHTHDFHGLLDETPYYDTAVGYILRYCSDAEFFVFSDDPVWAKQRFGGRPKFTFIDFNPMSGTCDVDGNIVRGPAGNGEAEDLYLMSLCRHGIIANSSFSWWGAWLGDDHDRLVIAPRRWFTAPHMAGEDRDIVPERWIRL